MKQSFFKYIFLCVLFILNCGNGIIHLTQGLVHDFMKGFFLSCIVGIFISLLVILIFDLYSSFTSKSFWEKTLRVVAFIVLVQIILVLFGAYLVILVF